MDHFREIKNTLSWHSPDGTFDVILINGVITSLNFCEPGGPGADCGKCLSSINYKFLMTVKDCLIELSTFIEEENKKMGYKFAEEKNTET